MMDVNEMFNGKYGTYLFEFYSDMVKEGLSDKSIKKHYNNVEFYLNEFLDYYEEGELRDGCYEIDSFLGDWFIRKAMWSNESAIKENCTSIKKFYKCMLAHGYIDKEDYLRLVETIKEEKSLWIKRVNLYNYTEDDWYVFD